MHTHTHSLTHTHTHTHTHSHTHTHTCMHAHSLCHSLSGIRYVFWNAHEHYQHELNFEGSPNTGIMGSHNLTHFISLARDIGLFVNMRIGPYVCAEWNMGGCVDHLHAFIGSYTVHAYAFVRAFLRAFSCCVRVCTRAFVHPLLVWYCRAAVRQKNGILLCDSFRN
jgi:hypothetical protein